MHVAEFKKKDPSYTYQEDPKTPHHDEEEDSEVIDPVARENMLKN